MRASTLHGSSRDVKLLQHLDLGRLLLGRLRQGHRQLSVLERARHLLLHDDRVQRPRTLERGSFDLSEEVTSLLWNVTFAVAATNGQHTVVDLHRDVALFEPVQFRFQDDLVVVFDGVHPWVATVGAAELLEVAEGVREPTVDFVVFISC